MNREEAIKRLETNLDANKKLLKSGVTANGEIEKNIAALQVAISALRGPTREQVSAACRGEWVKKHKHRGGFRRVTGVDDMGEEHTITIDERCEYDDLYCGMCGKQSADSFLEFCPACGAPMTDKGVDIIMKRLEALRDVGD